MKKMEKIQGKKHWKCTMPYLKQSNKKSQHIATVKANEQKKVSINLNIMALTIDSNSKHAQCIMFYRFDKYLFLFYSSIFEKKKNIEFNFFVSLMIHTQQR